MRLSENACRPLKPGERYVPVVPDSTGWKQVSPYSLVFGFLALVIFSGASVFLGVKIAQVPEAAISVCLLAMLFVKLVGRGKSLLENVIVQCIASASTGVACVIFVFPAVYILHLPDPGFWPTVAACVLGATFALLFTVLVRKYYVSDLHGAYPFPEATAGAQMLLAGETGPEEKDDPEEGRKLRKGVRLVVLGVSFGFLIDMANNYLGAWRGSFSTHLLPFFDKVAQKAKLLLTYETSAAVFGMGYIIGWRYSVIICITSAVAYWGFVPLFSLLDVTFLAQFLPDTLLKPSGVLLDIRAMEPGDIFKTLVRPIGIGTFFTAGLLSIILDGKNIARSVKQLFGKGTLGLGAGETKENSRDLSGRWLAGLLAVTFAGIVGFCLHLFGTDLVTVAIVVVVLLVLLLVFLPAAIMATITAGNAPVSGMTIVSLVLTCLILGALGYSGEAGKFVATMLGTLIVVCLAFGSSFITDLKIGYWLGSTPAKQERWKLVAVVVSTMVAVLAMYVVNDQYGFVETAEHPNPMPAPQARAMADIISTFMGGGQAAWALYGLGAAIALAMRLIFGISPIVVALGLYIPMEYNLPLLLGAWVGRQLGRKRTGESDAEGQTRHSFGEMAAIGLIAAGSVAGILSAVLKYFGLDLRDDFGLVLPADMDWSNWISLAVVVLTVVFLYGISNERKRTS